MRKWTTDQEHIAHLIQAGNRLRAIVGQHGQCAATKEWDEAVYNITTNTNTNDEPRETHGKT